MRTLVKIAPSNSILFITDISGGKIPEITRDRKIWSTSSCIVFGCLAFMDGETEITLAAADDFSGEGKPAFDGMLDTPGLSVSVSTVEGKTILSAPASNQITRVRLWTNHPTEPDKVLIGLG